MSESWLTVYEIAEHLSIKRDIIYKWVKDALCRLNRPLTTTTYLAEEVIRQLSDITLEGRET